MSVARRGLARVEAERLLARHGPNVIPSHAPPSLLRRVVRQLRSPIVYILLFALAVDVAKWIYEGRNGWPVEAIAIAAVLILNTVLGVVQEYRSEQAIAQLKVLAEPMVWVIRDGETEQIPSRGLVPGDLLRLEAGERIPADAELVAGSSLVVDESVLTGESVPIYKSGGDKLLSGTLAVRGKAHAVVTQTGAASNLGKLAGMLGGIEVGKTPLERRLDQFGNRVARWVGALTVVVVAAGTAIEGLGRADEMLVFAVALGVAVVPEGLPAVVTLTLALGVQRMAKRHAIARRLSAVEALGSVTVIATDKTGTLTENRMSVSSLESPDREEALQAMILANDAELDSAAGDPLERALLEYAKAQGVDVERIRRQRPRSCERPFDSEWKFMRVTLAGDDVSYLKGAPEELLARSRLPEPERAEWRQRAETGAARGHKVLALARGHGTDESSLDFLGLAMLWDPPRPEVAGAIRTARSAGVRIVMITGDHPSTARAIAEAIGIGSPRSMTGAELERLAPAAQQEAVQRIDVFARITPEDKLKIVERLKAAGEIVAVTGDGVNDAPALKRSDVGVAMGQRGSAVAREVADLVLVDDNFASIVAAIEEGRTIFANIEKFIRYTFSTNVALIILMVCGAVTSYAYQLRDAGGMLLLPLSAAQLLWINFIGDGPPALALALDRNRDVMLEPPRHPAKGLLAGAPVRFILLTGAIKGVVGVALLWLFAAAGVGILVIRAAVFLYESIAKLVSVYPARRVASTSPQHNAALHVSVGLGVGLQLATVLVPGLRRLLQIEMPQLPAFGVVTAAIALTAILIEITNWRVRRGERLRVARAGEAIRGTPPASA